ncbi:oligosaccharide flippase family protein [Chitinophaga vietnamensis]|uniref:oligosaccharide flippase family protein n=1 Tax=Chitinophaga vietnamensis TaxID=2593957 RepID=UPI001178CA86|nr:oligosaccharide flippase family protein [Chitinophaga vietnamensis]
MKGFIGRNSVILTLCNVIQFLVALNQSVFLAHSISSKYEYGLLQQIFLVGSLFATVGTAIPSTMSFFWGKSFHDETYKSTFFQKYFLATIAVGLGTVLLQLALRPVIAGYFGNPYFNTWTWYLAGYFLLKCINNYANGFYLLTNKLQHLLIINTVQLVLSIGWLLYAAHVTLPVAEIFVGLVVLELFRFVYLLKDSPQFISFRHAFLAPIPREWKYLVTLMAVMLITMLNMQADRFIVSNMLGPVKYSDYAVGTFANPFIGLITGSLMTVLLPLFSKLYHEHNFPLIGRMWRRVNSRSCRLLLPLIVFTIFFGDKIILLIYPPKFENAARLFQLYNIKFIFTVVIFGSIINAIGKEKWMLLNAIINVITLSTLCFLLIPVWGLDGAIFSTIISTFIGYKLPVWLTKRYLHLSIKDYFPGRIFLQTLAVCCMISIVLKAGMIYLLPGKYIILLVTPVYMAFTYAYTLGVKRTLQQIRLMLKR